MIAPIQDAFVQVFTLGPLTAILFGTAFGIVIGALPGLGAVVGISICLPFTFGMPIIPSMSLLLGVYCGAVYGGSISAILINSPGTPQSAATTLDGYPMAMRGEAGLAIGWVTMSSTIGGLISCVILIIGAPQISRFATNFGSVEIFALIVLALTCISSVSKGAMSKGLLMGVVGLMLSLIGTDPVTGVDRFTFGTVFLSGGLDLIAVVIGVFALSEAFTRISVAQEPQHKMRTSGTRMVLPPASAWKGRGGILVRSSGIGCMIGALPGTGPATAAFVSYALAKQSSKRGENFGKGEPDGLISCEAANNAVTGSAMIPTLALGIPGDVVTAILMSALVIQGITPGVQLMAENSAMVNAIFLALILINIAMLFLAFPLIRIFGALLSLPERLIMTGVFIFGILGAITVRGNPLDAFTALVFGVIAMFLRAGRYPLAPLVIGLVLGPQFEQNLRRGLLIHDGDFLAFFTASWIASLLFLVVLLVLLGPPLMAVLRARRQEIAY